MPGKRSNIRKASFPKRDSPILPSKRQIITGQVASSSRFYEADKRKAECVPSLNWRRMRIQLNSQVRLAHWRRELEMFARPFRLGIFCYSSTIPAEAPNVG